MQKKDNAPNGAEMERSIDEWFKELNKKMNANDQFNDEVYRLLPDFLSDFISVFIEKQEKETALFCMLTLLSGVLPNYKVEYMGDFFEANLYAYLYGSAGIGKGVMKKCKQVLMLIHKEKKERAARALLEYLQEQQQQRRRSKGKGKGVLSDEAVNDSNDVCNDNTDCNIEFSVMPPDEMLFVPANNSKSNIYKLAYENDGRFIISEPEALTLITALKQEFGAFTDLLLLAFHHETYSYSRKADRTIEIEFPCLTILLSSTHQHVNHFFKDVENGLYSRFVFYKVYSTPEFKQPFYERMVDHSVKIQAKAEYVKKLYKELQGHKEMPVYFRFTKAQASTMQEHFQNLKNEYRTVYNDEMDGVVHRYGLIFTRIAMVLSMLRQYDEHPSLEGLDNEIVCKDSDYRCASLIVETLFEQTIKVYEMIMETRKPCLTNTSNEYAEKLSVQRRCGDLYLKGYTFSQIAGEVLGNENLKGTAYKYVKKLGLITPKK